MRVRLHGARSSGRSLGVVFPFLVGILPATGMAQETPSVVAGAIVRVKPTGPGARWVQGELVALTADSVMIRLREPRDTVALATRTLVQFQVSQGRSARTGKGALVGIGIGAGAGLLLGLAAAADNCTGCEIHVGPGDVLALTALGGGLGAGVGALIGAVSHSELWQPAGESYAAMRRGPAVPRGSLGLQIRF